MPGSYHQALAPLAKPRQGRAHSGAHAASLALHALAPEVGLVPELLGCLAQACTQWHGTVARRRGSAIFPGRSLQDCARDSQQPSQHKLRLLVQLPLNPTIADQVPVVVGSSAGQEISFLVGTPVSCSESSRNSFIFAEVRLDLLDQNPAPKLAGNSDDVLPQVSVLCFGARYPPLGYGP